MFKLMESNGEQKVEREIPLEAAEILYGLDFDRNNQPWDEWREKQEGLLLGLGLDLEESRDDVEDMVIRQALFEYAESAGLFSESDFIAFVEAEGLSHLYALANFEECLPVWQQQIVDAFESWGIPRQWCEAEEGRETLHGFALPQPLLPAGLKEVQREILGSADRRVARGLLEARLREAFGVDRKTAREMLKGLQASGYIGRVSVGGAIHIELAGAERPEIDRPSPAEEKSEQLDPGFSPAELDAAALILGEISQRGQPLSKGGKVRHLAIKYQLNHGVLEQREFRRVVRRLAERGYVRCEERKSTMGMVVLWKSVAHREAWLEDSSSLLQELTLSFAPQEDDDIE